MSDRPTPEAEPTPAEPEAPAATAVATVEPPAEATTPPAEASPVEAPPAEAAAPGVGTPAPAATALGTQTPEKHTVQVPVWLLAVVVGLVLVVGAFLVGRETAPESGDSGPATLAEAVEMTAGGEMEVGDFDARALLQALSQNEDLDLGIIGDLLLGGGGRG